MANLNKRSSYTIGRLAKCFGLSRSTLIYYDSIGLLKPSGRSEANYRLYSELDLLRMQKIVMYREAGLPLGTICTVLSTDNVATAQVLEQRLEQINAEIGALRSQQTVIINLLKNRNALGSSRVLTKDRWIALLKSTGLSEQDMNRWHIEFERMAPEAHQDFLESLGIEPEEVKSIRQWSRRD